MSSGSEANLPLVLSATGVESGEESGALSSLSIESGSLAVCDGPGHTCSCGLCASGALGVGGGGGCCGSWAFGA